LEREIVGSAEAAARAAFFMAVLLLGVPFLRPPRRSPGFDPRGMAIFAIIAIRLAISSHPKLRRVSDAGRLRDGAARSPVGVRKPPRKPRLGERREVPQALCGFGRRARMPVWEGWRRETSPYPDP
jgi:hypothetical protein